VELLTERQMEILRMVAKGNKYKEIAAKLGLAEVTVKYHMGEILARLRELGEKADLATGLAYIGFVGELSAAEESVAIARTLKNKWILAYALAWQSQALRLAGGDLQLARTAAAESTRLARELGSAWAVARSVLSQGQLAAASGQPDQARSYLREAMLLFSKSQDEYHANTARTGLAHLERGQGDYTNALRLYQESILVWQDWGLQAAVAQDLECMALIAAGQGNLEHAVRLAGAAKKLRQQTGTHPTPQEQKEFDESLEIVHSQLPAALYNSLLADGQEMTISEAITYASDLPTKNGL
jgi:ATP/maltotriose-dependent transcriptional regulator MalT